MQPAAESAHVLADSPSPPPTAAAWRHRVHAALNTRRAHALVLAVILADVLVNISGLLLALFTCRTSRHRLAASARAAEEALRWTSAALLAAMLLELLARAFAVGPVRFFAAPLHALDAAVLAGLLAVEAAVSDSAAEEALGLLVVVRLARIVRLTASLEEFHAERHGATKARTAALERRVAELSGRVAELQAALLEALPPDGAASR